jgi:hypothetical protein
VDEHIEKVIAQSSERVKMNDEANRFGVCGTLGKRKPHVLR